MKHNLNDKLSKERVKVILTKNLLEDSYYGILGIHPGATINDIEEGFTQKIKETSTNDKLSKVLKAYSTLSSGYKEIYDDYLEKYKIGIEKVSELISGKNVSIDDIIQQTKVKENDILPEGVFMQPWATTL